MGRPPRVTLGILQDALAKAGLTHEELEWKCAEAQRHGTVYAKVPVRILRREARRAGFTSTKDYLDSLRAEGPKHSG